MVAICSSRPNSCCRASPSTIRTCGVRADIPATSIGGRQGMTTTLSNVSDATGEPEAVNVSTVQLRDGSLLFIIGVAPSDESRTYLNTFNRVRQTVQLSDR